MTKACAREDQFEERGPQDDQIARLHHEGSAYERIVHVRARVLLCAVLCCAVLCCAVRVRVRVGVRLPGGGGILRSDHRKAERMCSCSCPAHAEISL
jgi:hypothetical protein